MGDIQYPSHLAILKIKLTYRRRKRITIARRSLEVLVNDKSARGTQGWWLKTKNQNRRANKSRRRRRTSQRCVGVVVLPQNPRRDTRARTRPASECTRANHAYQPGHPRTVERRWHATTAPSREPAGMQRANTPGRVWSACIRGCLAPPHAAHAAIFRYD
jgi:hypothetical protein